MHSSAHTHTLYLPVQGAGVAVGTATLRENTKLDRELHDSMLLRQLTQINLSSPSLSFSVSLAASLALAVFLDPLSLMFHPRGTVCLH